MRNRRVLGMGWVVAVGLAAAMGVGLGAQAEIYRWVDAAGRVHFTEDLRQVPTGQRRAVEEAARAPVSVSPIQIYSAPAARTRSMGRARRATPDVDGRIYRIRVQRAGSGMRVSVRINGQLAVPFLIDTGATDVVLPQWAADELGLDLSEARTGVYGTANGVIEQKLVRLDTVSLQGAEVRDVPATVSPSLREGLLGLSYFNHFKYNIDPVAGIVTLQHNGLAESGLLRGGKSREQWRSHFTSMNARIRAAEKSLEAVPFGRTRRRAAIKQDIARLGRERTQLEAEADDARVPAVWRD